MAAFDVTVDGACKGKAEDIALMKQRLAALLNNQDKLDDPDWLRELFGEEIDDLVDLDDEDAVSEVFGGFRIEWSGNRFGDGSVDTDDLQFSGSPGGYNQTGGEEVGAFLSAIKDVFPRVEFHFISWCYISWGHYSIFMEDEEDVEEYGWDEEDDGLEKKDAYVAWRLAYREYWLLDEAAPAEERAAAKAAEEEAEKAFNLLLSSGDEDEEEKSSDDWLAVVSTNGYALADVPESLRTADLCLAAVQKHGGALYAVPKSMKTVEVCLAAVQQDGSALENVPESLLTAEVCLAAVQQKGRALYYVPESLRTAELCLAAVRQDDWAHEYVPEALQEQVKQAAGNR